MPKARLLLTFIFCLIAIIFLVGCNALQSVLKDNDERNAPLTQLLDRVQKGRALEREATPVMGDVEGAQGETVVRLYFAEKDGQGLIEVNRSIPKTLSLARETVTQWLKGPTPGTADAYPAVNPETLLLDINLKNGIATVDLSKDFLQSYSNVSPRTTLYGLVNTVAQFSTVEIVKIRVEGQEIDSFHGLDLKDLRFNSDLIRASSGSSTENIAETVEPAQGSPSSINIFQ